MSLEMQGMSYSFENIRRVGKFTVFIEPYSINNTVSYLPDVILSHEIQKKLLKVVTAKLEKNYKISISSGSLYAGGNGMEFRLTAEEDKFQVLIPNTQKAFSDWDYGYLLKYVDFLLDVESVLEKVEIEK